MNWTFNQIFHRNIIFSNLPLNGYYQYKSVFQLIPGKKGWPSLKVSFENRPIILEFDSSAFPKFKQINEYTKYQADLVKTQEQFRFLDHKKETFALLTLVANANFYDEERYSLSNDELGKDYFMSTFTVMGDSLEIPRNSEYIQKKQNYLGDSITFPKNCDLFFDSYFNLDDEILNRTRMSILLYYNAIDIRKFSPSMSYIALVSAIENLVDYESDISKIKYENCKSCGQTMFKLGKRYTDFMINYCENRSPEFKKYLSKAYSKRSHMAHLGKLFYNDYANTELDLQGDNEIVTLKLFTRLAIYNWVVSKIGYNSKNKRQ